MKIKLVLVGMALICSSTARAASVCLITTATPRNWEIVVVCDGAVSEKIPYGYSPDMAIQITKVQKKLLDQGYKTVAATRGAGLYIFMEK